MRLTFHAALATCVFLALPASAQVAGEGDKSPSRLDAPPLGVPTPVSHGLFADLQIGAFFTLNGGAEAPNRQLSNAQPFLGLAVGYDLTPSIQAGIGFAHGSSSGTCYGTFGDTATGPGCADGADSFSVLMLNAFGGYLHPVSRRVFLGAKLSTGLAILTPRPVAVNGEDGPAIGFNAGILASAEYHTHLDHFVLGLDVGGHYVSGGSGAAFPGIAIYPHLKYVF